MVTAAVEKSLIFLGSDANHRGIPVESVGFSPF